jgi:hypothetical protein
MSTEEKVEMTSRKNLRRSKKGKLSKWRLKTVEISQNITIITQK